MGEKATKKIIVLLVIVFFMIALFGCDGSNPKFKLDHKKYTDVALIQLDVHVVNENGLMYLIKKGKKITKGYSIIAPLTYGDTILDEEDMVNYFLGRNLDGEFVILDIEGNEKVINHKIKGINYITKEGLIVVTESDKHVFIRYSGTTSEKLYDHISVIYNSSDNIQGLIAYNKVTEGQNKYFLLNLEGDEKISYVDSISKIELEDPNILDQYTTFLKVKIGETYRLARTDGSYLGATYDSIDTTSNLIKCVNYISYTVNDVKLNGEKITYYNYNASSFSYESIDQEGNLTSEIDRNDYLICYRSNKNNQSIVHKFNGDANNYDSIVDKYYYYKFTSGNEVGFIDKKGSVIYREEYDAANELMMVKTNVYQDTYYFLMYSSKDSKYISYINGSVTSLSVPNDSSNHYSMEFPLIPYVYISKKLDNEFNYKYALYLPKIETSQSIDSLTYYDEIKTYNVNGIYYALAKDLKSGIYYFIDLITGKKTNLGTKINTNNIDVVSHIIDKNILANVDNTQKYNTINGFVLKVMYWIETEYFEEKYIVYKNKIYNNADADTKILYIDQASVNHKIGDNYIFVIEDDITSIYKFEANENEYVLKKSKDIQYKVTKTLIDNVTNEVYYVITDDFMDLYGLCDISGNILIYPQYSDINEIQNKNLIVSKNNRFGVIKIKDNGTYKLIANIIYKYINFYGDGDFIATDASNKSFFCKNSGSKEKDEVIAVDRIPYTSKLDGQFINIEAYKIDFGGYVRIFYGTEELKKIYPYNQPN